MLLQLGGHKVSAAAAMTVDIDEAGRKVVAAAVNHFIGAGRLACSVPTDFAAVLQQPAVGQQPIGQNQRCVGKQPAHNILLIPHPL